MTYSDVRTAIISFLTGRPYGQKVLVAEHQAAELMILDYIEQLSSAVYANMVKEAHASATASVNCTLVWNIEFPNTNYSFVLTGYDARGGPVEVKFISKHTTHIIVKTLVNATINAIAVPFGVSP
jgi:hypothetical protein